MFLPRSLNLAMYQNENQQIIGIELRIREFFFVTSIKISTLKQLLLIIPLYIFCRYLFAS